MANDLVEVRRCQWLHEAQFLQSVLAAAGIESAVPDEYTLGIQPLYGEVLGGVRLLVHPEEHERACEVLDTQAQALSPPTARQ